MSRSVPASASITKIRTCELGGGEGLETFDGGATDPDDDREVRGHDTVVETLATRTRAEESGS